mmetsp:Transcript_96429/g.176583  ORF Transcript_96429/g.176583 Transcript_96429/m.176583 type:complete len:268 (-) Transcript_96429:46-849(-)
MWQLKPRPDGTDLFNQLWGQHGPFTTTLLKHGESFDNESIVYGLLHCAAATIDVCPEGAAQNRDGLCSAATGDETADELLRNSRVWHCSVSQGLFEDRNCSLRVTTVETCLEKCTADMRVHPEPVFLRDLLHDLEGLGRLPSLAEKPHEHCKCVVAWLHTHRAHLLEKPLTLRHQACRRAALKDGVEDNLVRPQARRLAQILQCGEGGGHVAPLAIALDDRAVGDQIWLQVTGLHLLPHLRQAIHAAIPRTRIDDSIECDHGRFDAM